MMASAGAGSAGAVEGKSEREELSEKISELREESSRLQSEGMLSDLSNEFSRIEADMGKASEKFDLLRGKGYIYGVAMEDKLLKLRETWKDRKREAQDELEEISREIRRKGESVDREVRELRDIFERNYKAAEGRCRDTENRLDEFKKFIDSAEDRIEAKYKTVKDDLYKVTTHLREVEESFNLMDKASFKLHQGENLIYVCGAQHLEDRKKKGPKGYIYLTDNRFIFEQNEEVVVSRRLLFFTKKELVHKIIVDKPIGALDEIKDTEAGFIFKAELLDLTFKDGSAPNEMMLKLSKDSTMLKNLIQRIISGDIERDKVGARPPTGGLAPEGAAGVPGAAAPPPAVAEALSEPKDIRCSGCGAAYDEPVLKGMNSVSCPYCGTTIRL